VSGRGGPAARLDLAIDDLLVDRRRPVEVGTADLLATARLLRDSLPRYHPRFGFEEHLARRLAAAALPGASGVRGGIAAIGRPVPVIPVRALAEEGLSPAPRRRRGLLAGGAIASGVSLAIPLAGAALVAWRRGRAAGGSL
jgi:hypothetical protein